MYLSCDRGDVGRNTCWSLNTVEGIASSTGTSVAAFSGQQIHIFDWSNGETLAECPFSGGDLRDFDLESSIVRTGWEDFTLTLESGHHQATQIFGAEPEGGWIQWKGLNLFRLPPDFREVTMEVKAIPGDAMGFTVVIGSSSRGVVIMRFSNEGGMLDDIVY
jgi:hypothetical protein